MRRVSWLVSCLAVLVIGVFIPSVRAEPVTLTWLKWGGLEPYGTLIEQFEAENPDIRIEVVQAEWADIRERVIVGVAAKTGPDIVSVSSGWGEALARAGVLLDLRPLLEADPDLDTGDFLPPAWPLWQSDAGMQYAFPHDFDVNIPFINVDMFQRAGLATPGEDWTWSDMQSIAAKLTNDTDGDGEADQWGFSPWFMDYWILIWSNGGDILTEDMTASALNSPEAVEALEYFAEFWPGRSGYIPGLEYDWEVMFRRGRVGIQPSGPWYVSTLRDSMVAFVYDVVGMPFSPRGIRATTLGGASIAITTATPHVDEAYRFLKYLASEHVQTTMAEVVGSMPVLHKAAVSPSFLAGEGRPRNMQAFVEATEYGRPNPKTIYWTDIRDAFYQEISPYLRGETFLEQALSNFATRVASLTGGGE